MKTKTTTDENLIFSHLRHEQVLKMKMIENRQTLQVDLILKNIVYFLAGNLKYIQKGAPEISLYFSF